MYFICNEKPMISQKKKVEPVFSNIEAKILEELSHARKSIRVAVGWFTSYNLLSKLEEKVTEGVQVEIVTSTDEKTFAPSVYKDLVVNGGLVYSAGQSGKWGSFMHHKFCVIDQETVITGSFNWSKKASGNIENTTIIRDRSIANKFSAEFENVIKNGELLLWIKDHPTISITANKWFVNPDEEVEISWIVKNANKVFLNGKEVESKGKEVIQSKTDFSQNLWAQNDEFHVSKTIHVTILERPLISLEFELADILTGDMKKVNSLFGDSFHIHEGQVARIKFDVKNADRLFIDGVETKRSNGYYDLVTDVSKTIIFQAFNQEVQNDRSISLMVTPIRKFDTTSIPLPGKIEIAGDLIFKEVTVPDNLNMFDFPVPKRLRIPSISGLKTIYAPSSIPEVQPVSELNSKLKNIKQDNSVMKVIGGFKRAWKRNLKNNRALLNFFNQLNKPNGE